MKTIIISIFILLCASFSLAAETVHYPVTFPDGVKVQTNRIFNAECEVRFCRPDEYYDGIFVRWDVPGRGWYEIYMFQNKPWQYRHMFPGGANGEASKDGFNWGAYNYGQ